MATQTKINIDLSGLDDLAKRLGTQYYARVGILGSSAGEMHKKEDGTASEMTMAAIGVIQEFGSESLGIPPRSFLRMPITEKMRDFVRFLGSTTIGSLFDKGNIEGIFKAMGIEAEAIITDAFDTRGFGLWKPNAPSTIANKGSDAPLIDTGQLRKSITSDVVKKW